MSPDFAGQHVCQRADIGERLAVLVARPSWPKSWSGKDASRRVSGDDLVEHFDGLDVAVLHDQHHGERVLHPPVIRRLRTEPAIVGANLRHSVGRIAIAQLQQSSRGSLGGNGGLVGRLASTERHCGHGSRPGRDPEKDEQCLGNPSCRPPRPAASGQNRAGGSSPPTARRLFAIRSEGFKTKTATVH